MATINSLKSFSDDIAWLVEQIDLRTAPDVMDQSDAISFLERLATEIDCRIDGLKDDLRDRS